MLGSRRPVVKICGNTSAGDALAAEQAGADFLGVVLDVRDSPRSVGAQRAAEIGAALPTSLVIVLVNKALPDIARLVKAVRPSAVQLHGDETPEDVARIRSQLSIELWKAVHINAAGRTVSVQMLREYEDAGVAMFVVDSIVRTAKKTVYGGTGKTTDWPAARRLVAEARIPCLLAGGITPQNADSAIRAVGPAGLDVASGVELRPGVKDPEKMRRLVAAVRECQATP